MGKVLCFGEVLWDIIEGTSYIGGAPFNVSAHLKKLGTDSALLTCVGKDKLGLDAIKIAKDYGIDDILFQFDNLHQTGKTTVCLDENKIPSYKMCDNVAYENIFIDGNTIELINKQKYNMFYFGSMMQQFPISKNTIYTILDNCKFDNVFFDVNIRQNFCPKKMLIDSLKYTDILKVNEEEIVILGKILFNSLIEENIIYRIIKEYSIKIILITRGKNGCSVYDKDYNFSVNECKYKAIDTVGAGDAFSAGFIHSYLSGMLSLGGCACYGNILADYVANNNGAVPNYSQQIIKRLKNIN